MGAQIGEAVRWRVTLPRDVSHVALTRAMAEEEVALFGFEPIKADLEGAFWSLAGLKDGLGDHLAQAAA